MVSGAVGGRVAEVVGWGSGLATRVFGAHPSGDEQTKRDSTLCKKQDLTSILLFVGWRRISQFSCQTPLLLSILAPAGGRVSVSGTELIQTL